MLIDESRGKSCMRGAVIGCFLVSLGVILSDFIEWS